MPKIASAAKVTLFKNVTDKEWEILSVAIKEREHSQRAKDKSVLKRVQRAKNKLSEFKANGSVPEHIRKKLAKCGDELLVRCGIYDLVHAGAGRNGGRRSVRGVGSTHQVSAPSPPCLPTAVENYVSGEKLFQNSIFFNFFCLGFLDGLWQN